MHRALRHTFLRTKRQHYPRFDTTPYPAVVGRNNPANKKPWTTDKKPLAL